MVRLSSDELSEKSAEGGGGMTLCSVVPSNRLQNNDIFASFYLKINLESILNQAKSSSSCELGDFYLFLENTIPVLEIATRST